jgi:hypothetical protein
MFYSFNLTSKPTDKSYDFSIWFKNHVFIFVFTQKNSYYRSTGILVKETQHAEYPSKYNLKKRFKIQIQFKYLLFLAIKVSKGYHLLSCWEKRKVYKKFRPHDYCARPEFCFDVLNRYRCYCNSKVLDIAKSFAQLTPMRTKAADSRTKIFITLGTQCRPNYFFENRMFVEQRIGPTFTYLRQF